MMLRRSLFSLPLWMAVPFVKAQIPKSSDCEVLIIGAGAAGLSAGVAAKEAGIGSVALIEKNPSPFFSSTSYSAGSVNASGTLAQKEHGIHDENGTEEFIQELLTAGDFKNDKNLVRLYAENAAETLDWFSERGIIFTPAPNIAFSKYRMHGCDRHSGSQYVEVLFSEAKSLGVDIRFGVRALSLITDDNGAVRGVRVSTGFDQKDIYASRAVVLATGGFAGDVERVDLMYPDYKGSPTFSSPASRGEGLDMAMSIDAATHFLSCSGAYAYGFTLDEETRRGLIFRGHVMNLYGSITVNAEGKRFINDDLNSTQVANFLASKGIKRVYQLASKKQLDRFLSTDQIQVIGWDRARFLQEMEEEKYFIRKGRTIKELAGKMGIPYAELNRTISRYNGFVKTQEDLDFGRKHLIDGFEEGPFFGFVCTPIVGISSGGLRVDSTQRVMRKNGKQIEGLYAVGEIVGGTSR